VTLVPGAETPDASDDKDATHRLFGIFVKEVSLVDRAANKRTFLVTKRDTTMAKAAKTTVAKGPEQGAAETAADAAGSPPGGGPDGAGAPTQGGTGDATEGKLPAMQPQAKDALLQALMGLATKLVDVSDMVKDAPTDENAAGPALPPSVAKELTEISQALNGMLAQAGTAPAADGAGASQTKDLEGASENGGVVAQGSQKSEAAIVAGVEKAGRKMAKERLSRLATVLSTLSGIYRELNTEKGAAVAKAAVPPGAVAITKGEIDSMVGMLEELTKARETDRKDIVAAQETIRGLTAANAELAKRTGAPNSLSVEGGGGGGAGGGGSVGWPMDMNSAPKTNGAAARRP
jgi:hypothetical protein